jgi:hypothetical protein
MSSRLIVVGSRSRGGDRDGDAMVTADGDPAIAGVVSVRHGRRV